MKTSFDLISAALGAIGMGVLTFLLILIGLPAQLAREYLWRPISDVVGVAFAIVLTWLSVFAGVIFWPLWAYVELRLKRSSK